MLIQRSLPALYEHGAIELLTGLGGISYATGVNNHNEIVGCSYLCTGGSTLPGFVRIEHRWSAWPLGGSTSEALVINDRGVIVGAAELPGDHETHGHELHPPRSCRPRHTRRFPAWRTSTMGRLSGLLRVSG